MGFFIFDLVSSSGKTSCFRHRSGVAGLQGITHCCKPAPRPVCVDEVVTRPDGCLPEPCPRLAAGPRCSPTPKPTSSSRHRSSGGRRDHEDATSHQRPVLPNQPITRACSLNRASACPGTKVFSDTKAPSSRPMLRLWRPRRGCNLPPTTGSVQTIRTRPDGCIPVPSARQPRKRCHRSWRRAMVGPTPTSTGRVGDAYRNAHCPPADPTIRLVGRAAGRAVARHLHRDRGVFGPDRRNPHCCGDCRRQPWLCRLR